jgi:subtilisin family serine protease
VYRVLGARTLPDVLAALEKDPRITLAQPLQQFHTLSAPSGSREQSTGAQQPASPPPAGPAYNDPLYDLQTNLHVLDIEAAHTRSQGAGVRVGLIDTGVDTQHPDLRGRIAVTHSFIPGGTRSARAYRHGTAMAGLIAADANNGIGVVGIAPLARIEVFEACWQLELDSAAAQCNTFTLARALEAALDSGVPIVNISIGGPADPLLSALIATGLKRGIIFVGSTGGSGDMFPTATAGVIGVSGTDRAGPQAVLAVPASHVLTLHPGGQYDFESGTSVAAAQATGIIALLLAANPHLSSDRVVSLLRSANPTRNSAESRSVTVIDAGVIAAALDLSQQRMAASASP